MKWIVNIENDRKKRISVVFNPMDETISFFGQYKEFTEWVNFSEKHLQMDADLASIQIVLLEVYDLMQKRFEAYQNLEDGFKVIKTIEIDESNI